MGATMTMYPHNIIMIKFGIKFIIARLKIVGFISLNCVSLKIHVGVSRSNILFRAYSIPKSPLVSSDFIFSLRVSRTGKYGRIFQIEGG